MSNSELDGGKSSDSSDIAGTESTASADADPDPLPVDLVFDALSNERRQRLLSRLRHDDPSSLVDLAEHIAAWENNTTIGTVSREARSRVYTGLYHSHIPRLVDMGIVEYDRETDLISLTARADQLEPYLDAATEAGY